MGWTFERTEADIARLAERSLDKDDFCWATGERIAKAMSFDASCWHTHDPATLLITSHITERLPFCRFELLAHNEYATDDVNLFAELATSRRRVRTLRGATRNRPDSSERYRELFVPNGLDGELRAALVDGGSCWGGLIITRDTGHPDFSAEETGFLSRLSRPLAKGMRASILTTAAHREPGPDAPGLVVVDAHGEVHALSQSAISWLQEIDDGADELPAAVLSTASAARRAAPGETPPHARVRTAGGRWVVLHGSRMTDEPDHIAVVIAPATPLDIVALLLGAYGLTAREREVADLVMRGQSTAQVSAHAVHHSLHRPGPSQSDLRKGRRTQPQSSHRPRLLRALPAPHRRPRHTSRKRHAALSPSQLPQYRRDRDRGNRPDALTHSRASFACKRHPTSHAV